MKFFILFALVAAALAEPEPEAQTVYTDGVFHTNAANLAKGIHTQHVKPVGSLYNVQKTPVLYKNPLVYKAPGGYKQPIIPATTYIKPAVTGYTPGLTHPVLGYNSPLFQRLFKREAEAEAEPEADPWTIYRQAGVWPTQYSTLGYNTLGYKTLASPVVGSPVVGSPIVRSPYVSSVYGMHPYRLFKREADAEPEADAEADPWMIYRTTGVLPAGYTTLGYNTLGYKTLATPVVSSPVVGNPIVRSPVVSSVYGMHPYRLFKREAESEPEADPLKIYHNAGIYNTGVTGVSGVLPYTAGVLPYTNTWSTPYVNSWAGKPVTYMNNWASPYMTYY